MNPLPYKVFVSNWLVKCKDNFILQVADDVRTALYGDFCAIEHCEGYSALYVLHVPVALTFKTSAFCKI
jgi:hypothetical protein